MYLRGRVIEHKTPKDNGRLFAYEYIKSIFLNGNV